MRFIGVFTSNPSPCATAVAGAGRSAEYPLGSSYSPHPRNIQTNTLGKRSRKQLDSHQDSAVAGRLPSARHNEELRLARLPPGSYRDEEKGVEDEEEQEDLNDDECFACQERGQLLCCEGCPRSYHLYCLDPPLHAVPKHSWKCGDCSDPLAVWLDDDGAYSRARRAFTSQCKDVALDARANKWRVRRWDGAQGKRVDIGWYDIEEDAERAYQTYVKSSASPGRTRKVQASPFRGVSWHKGCKLWQTRITFNGKRVFLGLFRTEKEAALAYNAEVERTGRPISWLNDLNHAGSAGDGGYDHSKASAGGKKAMVATRAKLPRRQLIDTGARGASKNPNPVTAKGSDVPHLSLYELQREANIARNKARMVALGVTGLARTAGLATEHPPSPPPTMLHPVLAAARASTSRSMTVGEAGENETRQIAGPSLAAPEEAAMEARIEALEAEAALAEAKAVLAEKRLSARDEVAKC